MSSYPPPPSPGSQEPSGSPGPAEGSGSGQPQGQPQGHGPGQQYPGQQYPGYGPGQQYPGPQQYPGYGQGQPQPGYGAGQQYPGYGPGQQYPGYGADQQYPGQQYPGYGAGQQYPGQQYPGYGQGQQYPGQYPGHAGAQYPGAEYPGGQYPGGQYPGAQYPGAQYPGADQLGPGDALVPRSFSEWISKVVGVVTRSWQLLIIIQLVAALPGLLVGVVARSFAIQATTVTGSVDGYPPSVSGNAVAGLSAGLLLVTLVSLIFAVFAQGASVFVAVRDAVGRPTTIGQAVSFAAGRALPLLGWSLLAGLMVMVGFLLLVLPGLYVLIVIYASLGGVVVIERQGIGRMFALVNRRFWPTAGRILAFALAALVYYLIVSFLAATLSGGSPFLSSLISVVLLLPFGLAGVGVAVVTYAELRHHENPAVGVAALAAQMES